MTGMMTLVLRAKREHLMHLITQKYLYAFKYTNEISQSRILHYF